MTFHNLAISSAVLLAVVIAIELIEIRAKYRFHKRQIQADRVASYERDRHVFESMKRAREYHERHHRSAS